MTIRRPRVGLRTGAVVFAAIIAAAATGSPASAAPAEGQIKLAGSADAVAG